MSVGHFRIAQLSSLQVPPQAGARGSGRSPPVRCPHLDAAAPRNADGRATGSKSGSRASQAHRCAEAPGIARSSRSSARSASPRAAWTQATLYCTRWSSGSSASARSASRTARSRSPRMASAQRRRRQRGACTLGVPLEFPPCPLQREPRSGERLLGPPQPPLDCRQDVWRVDVVGAQLRGPAEQPRGVLHPPLLEAERARSSGGRCHCPARARSPARTPARPPSSRP